MHVCLCVYLYFCLSVCMYVYTYVCIYVCEYVFWFCACLPFGLPVFSVCMYACTHVCMHARMCMRVCARTFSWVYISFDWYNVMRLFVKSLPASSLIHACMHAYDWELTRLLVERGLGIGFNQQTPHHLLEQPSEHKFLPPGKFLQKKSTSGFGQTGAISGLLSTQSSVVGKTSVHTRIPVAPCQCTPREYDGGCSQTANPSWGYLRRCHPPWTH